MSNPIHGTTREAQSLRQLEDLAPSRTDTSTSTVTVRRNDSENCSRARDVALRSISNPRDQPGQHQHGRRPPERESLETHAFEEQPPERRTAEHADAPR